MNSLRTRWSLLILVSLCAFALAAPLAAQEPIPYPVPDRTDGEGPWDRVILRGPIVIDGTGAPPYGPVDIIVEGNIIRSIHNVGTGVTPIHEEDRPPAQPGDHEIRLEGHYILPGFLDMHLHQHYEGEGQRVPTEYIHKLWMAHGIATGADVGNFNTRWLLHHAERSWNNEITSPRIETFVVFGRDGEEPVTNPDAARRWVRWVKEQGADGIKFFGAAPRIFRAALDEAAKVGLLSTTHHAQLDVVGMNALDTARAGLTSMTHWYGLPEAMFADKTIQHYPFDYNYNNEYHRFTQAGRLWAQAAPPFSEKWNEVMNELLELDFTIHPTWVAYIATRDLMRQQRSEWHSVYTHPNLWEFYRPSAINHASYFFDWTTQVELNWKENYRLWMAFVNEFKNRGGRVVVGSDSGYTFNLYGFGFVQEMELFQEAGFHPLEVIKAATLDGAEYLGLGEQLGSIEEEKIADFVILEENPLHNLKVLYGTGTVRLNHATARTERIGSIKYLMKDGILYDTRKLLTDIRETVRAARAEQGLPPPPMPLFLEDAPDHEYPKPTKR